MFKMMISVVAVALLGVSLATPVEAAAVFTNYGTTTPTLGSEDTGNLYGPSDNGMGWTTGREFGQTFTLANDRTLDSIYFGYDDFDIDTTTTITLTVDSDGGTVYTETGIILDSSDFSQDVADSYIKIDLSSENIALTAGTSGWLLTATAAGGTGDPVDLFSMHPFYTTANAYSGGSGIGNMQDYNNADQDAVFAVTTTPEPATMTLLAIGGLGVLLKRRRRRA